MGNMDSSRRSRNEAAVSWVPTKKITKVVLTICVFCAAGHAFGANWRVEPYFSVREIYSDNIQFQSSGDQVDTFVTSLEPRISIHREGPWTFRLNYRMQNLFYVGSQTDFKINNQLQMQSNTKLIGDSIFLDSTSTIGQYNSSATGRITLDNISKSGNTGEYKTFRISPYWRPHFGGYVEGLARVGYSVVDRGNEGGGKSIIVDQYVNLRNGDEFDLIGWGINFRHQNIDRDSQGSSGSGNGDVTYQSYSGEIYYKLTDELKPFVEVGNYENDLPGQRNAAALRNGSYWAAGLLWQPSRKLFLKAGYGSRNHFLSLGWNPTRRTMFLMTYRQSEVGGAVGNAGYGGGGFGGGGMGGSGLGGVGFGGIGSSGFGGSGIGGGGFGGFGAGVGSCGTGFGGGGALGGAGFGGGGIGGAGLGGGGSFGGGGAFGGPNIGGTARGFGNTGFNAGETWSAVLCHRTRRTTWQASYQEFTTTIEQVLLNQPIFILDDPNNPDPTGVANEPFLVPIDQPDLTTDEVIVRKRAQASISLNTAKNMVGINGYQENRDYEFSPDQDVLGFTTTWNWRFAQDMSSRLLLLWQSIDSQTATAGSQKNDFMTVSVSLNRQFSAYSNGTLEFRHTEQTSDQSTGGYEENRITATVLMRF
jgi:hypothetical protein